jgi:PAS domain S-box-containing protein
MNKLEGGENINPLPPELLLTAIVAGSDDAIISKDLRGTIMSWNDAAQRIFGYSPPEVLGRSISILIPPDRQEEEASILARLAAGERIDHFETIRVAKDGRFVDVSLTISPIRDSSGHIIGASKIARDITDQKLAAVALQLAHQQLKLHAERLEAEVTARTAELRESLNELETFSSSIPHDIKGPLRAIRGFVELLRDQHGREFSAESTALLCKITESCARLQRFIENVLSYSRLGRGAVDLQRVDLAALIPRVLDEYPHAREANADVAVSQPLLPVLASEGLLMQSLANLISNAVKFVAPGTRPVLKIWTELLPSPLSETVTPQAPPAVIPAQANHPSKNYVRLWIQDNGIGIPEKDRQKIFNLFARLHSQAHYDGTGVGLAVVQRAMTRMGGSTGVESEVGKGSRFWIQLHAALA